MATSWAGVAKITQCRNNCRAAHMKHPRPSRARRRAAKKARRGIMLQNFLRTWGRALFRVGRVFVNPAPGKLGVSSGDDLRERFVVIDRATAEHGRPPDARTFARSVFDLGTDDTEAVALERRLKLGQRHLRRWCLQPHFDPSRSRSSSAPKGGRS